MCTHTYIYYNTCRWQKSSKYQLWNSRSFWLGMIVLLMTTMYIYTHVNHLYINACQPFIYIRMSTIYIYMYVHFCRAFPENGLNAFKDGKSIAVQSFKVRQETESDRRELVKGGVGQGRRLSLCMCMCLHVCKSMVVSLIYSNVRYDSSKEIRTCDCMCTRDCIRTCDMSAFTSVTWLRDIITCAIWPLHMQHDFLMHSNATWLLHVRNDLLTRSHVWYDLWRHSHVWSCATWLLMCNSFMCNMNPTWLFDSFMCVMTAWRISMCDITPSCVIRLCDLSRWRISMCDMTPSCAI